MGGEESKRLGEAGGAEGTVGSEAWGSIAALTWWLLRGILGRAETGGAGRMGDAGGDTGGLGLLGEVTG